MRELGRPMRRSIARSLDPTFNAWLSGIKDLKRGRVWPEGVPIKVETPSSQQEEEIESAVEIETPSSQQKEISESKSPVETPSSQQEEVSESGNEKPYPWRPRSCEPNNVSSEKEDVLSPPRKKTDQELLAEIVKMMEGTLES